MDVVREHSDAGYKYRSASLSYKHHQRTEKRSYQYNKFYEEKTFITFTYRTLDKIILTSLLGQSLSTIKKPLCLARFVVLEPATLNSILIVLLVTKAHYYMTQ